MLVTSAVHMPRAMGVAQHLGWKLIPWPSDYITRDKEVPWLHLPEDRMRYLRGALIEWAGLMSYRLAGRTDHLFPVPEKKGFVAAMFFRSIIASNTLRNSATEFRFRFWLIAKCATREICFHRDGTLG